MAQLTRIAPGVYVDQRNGLHLSVPELLEQFGYPDTEHNREIVTAEAERQLRALWPGVPLTITEAPRKRPPR